MTRHRARGYGRRSDSPDPASAPDEPVGTHSPTMLAEPMHGHGTAAASSPVTLAESVAASFAAESAEAGAVLAHAAGLAAAPDIEARSDGRTLMSVIRQAAADAFRADASELTGLPDTPHHFQPWKPQTADETGWNQWFGLATQKQRQCRAARRLGRSRHVRHRPPQTIVWQRSDEDDSESTAASDLAPAQPTPLWHRMLLLDDTAIHPQQLAECGDLQQQYQQQLKRRRSAEVEQEAGDCDYCNALDYPPMQEWLCDGFESQHFRFTEPC